MTTSTQAKKRAVGRPRILKKVITRNILISDEHIEAARKLNNESISAAVRAALINAKDVKFKQDEDFSKEAYEAQFINTKPRHIVLDEESQIIAFKLGKKNMSAGVRKALQFLIESQ